MRKYVNTLFISLGLLLSGCTATEELSPKETQESDILTVQLMGRDNATRITPLLEGPDGYSDFYNYIYPVKIQTFADVGYTLFNAIFIQEDNLEIVRNLPLKREDVIQIDFPKSFDKKKSFDLYITADADFRIDIKDGKKIPAVNLTPTIFYSLTPSANKIPNVFFGTYIPQEIGFSGIAEGSVGYQSGTTMHMAAWFKPLGDYMILGVYNIPGLKELVNEYADVEDLRYMEDEKKEALSRQIDAYNNQEALALRNIKLFSNKGNTGFRFHGEKARYFDLRKAVKGEYEQTSEEPIQENTTDMLFPHLKLLNTDSFWGSMKEIYDSPSSHKDPYYRLVAQDSYAIMFGISNGEFPEEVGISAVLPSGKEIRTINTMPKRSKPLGHVSILYVRWDGENLKFVNKMNQELATH